jgi:hypothetical protein
LAGAVTLEQRLPDGVGYPATGWLVSDRNPCPVAAPFVRRPWLPFLELHFLAFSHASAPWHGARHRFGSFEGDHELEKSAKAKNLAITRIEIPKHLEIATSKGVGEGWSYLADDAVCPVSLADASGWDC